MIPGLFPISIELFSSSSHGLYLHVSASENDNGTRTSIVLFLALPPQAQRHVTDLYEDLRDGHNLISLLEVLSGETLVSVGVLQTLRPPSLFLSVHVPLSPLP